MSSEQDLSCKSFTELVTDYLENQLSAARRDQVDDHLKICEGCVAYLDQMRSTVRLLARFVEESVPADERARLLEMFREWKRGK